LNTQIAIGSKPGIDAAKKIPGERFKREWPPLINMDEAVQGESDEPVASCALTFLPQASWVRELLLNPHAARPLPQLLIDKFQPFGKPQEAFAFVTEDERIKFEAGQGLP